MEKKILVVEDSRIFKRILEIELRQAGYFPVFAESIQETQELLKKQEQYTCAILDYCLPDGENGEIIDVCLKENLKVIVLTARMDEVTRSKVLSKPVIDYVPKDSPSSIASLIPILQRLENNKCHTVLVVDDSITARHYLRNLLERQNLTVLEAVNGIEAIEMIASHQNISLIITDYDMPKLNGIGVIKKVRQQFSPGRLAIIGLSASNENALTAKFIKAGANDFLTKPFNQEEFYCRVHSTLNLLESERQLYKMANTDYLTQCWNRRYFFNHLSVKRALQSRSVAILDIDFFKKINDTYGHHIGDMVLVDLAKHLRDFFPDALVARFGGEEFCIHFLNDHPNNLIRLEKFRSHIAQLQLNLLNQTVRYTVSIGVVVDIQPIHDLLSTADQCLYQAKDLGRNRLVIK